MAVAQVPRGNLVLTGSGSPEPAGSETVVTYAINVKNDGTFSATGVTVTITLPAGVQFAGCTTANPSGQPCQAVGQTVTATFASLPAHKTSRVNLKATMPAVSHDTSVSLAITAHADDAIGGEEPRDDDLTITSTVLPPTTTLLMSPSGRTVSISCGGTLDAATFGSDTEAQLQDGLVCLGHGLVFTASGKTLNLAGKKIVSGQRMTGNAGILVGPGAVNATINGSGTGGTRGIEQYEYCVKDAGGNDNLRIVGLRCFGAKGAGILTLSNGVVIESSLIDRAVADSNTETGAGGVGIEAGGDNLQVKNTIVRRSGTIGFWAYGVDSDGSGGASIYEGNTSTSKIENNAGIGALLSRGPHRIKGTQVLGDDPVDGTSTEGIVVASDAISANVDSVVIKKHRGDAIHVEAGAVGTVIARTSVEDIGGRGFVVDAQATLNGNSAALVVGDAFVVNGAAAVTSNSVENCDATAFVINAGATVQNNSAINNGGRGFVVGNSSPGGAAPDWVIAGLGDFDGSGNADILWRHTSGMAAIWLMNPAGTDVLAIGTFGVGTDWAVQGTGDFNGDGKTDILWRHSSGLMLVWLMDGITIAASGAPAGVGLDWSVQGVGDFNGDGRADILWRQTSGLVYVWLMNGMTIAVSGAPAGVGPEWAIQRVGDFDADGKADILWRSTSGLVYVWLMNGIAISASGAAAGVGPEWVIHGVGDFSGDGKADVLWRNTSGAPYIWLMNGMAIATAGSPGSMSSDWTVQGVGDVNSDGKADIVWRRPSGDLTTWFMSGTSVVNASGSARLRTNVAERNAQGGFLVSGDGNALEGNSAKSNTGIGFEVSGEGNALDTNAAERSSGSEFVIGAGNVDGGSNKANGTRFSFTAAGGTFE